MCTDRERKQKTTELSEWAKTAQGKQMKRYKCTILKAVSGHQAQCEVSTQTMWNDSYAAGRWHLCRKADEGMKSVHWVLWMETWHQMQMSLCSELQVGEKKRKKGGESTYRSLQKNHSASCRWNCILNLKRKKGNAGKKTDRLTHKGSKVYLCIRCNVEISKTWHIPWGKFLVSPGDKRLPWFAVWAQHGESHD